MSKSKNQEPWTCLFEKYEILDRIEQENKFIITAKQINEFREARLMTKFDSSAQLPKLFTESNLSILPISRGEYIIAKIKTFCHLSLEASVLQPKFLPALTNLESIDVNNITSEAMAIHCAYLSGILTDFIQDDHLQSTVSGRMSSQNFDFMISHSSVANRLLPVNVVNAQIEIDGGFESEQYLSLIEAKNSLSADFLIRQLYYPYRLWKSKVHKKVKPIFLVYTNGIFHLREYEFRELGHYNSIALVKEAKYCIADMDNCTINMQTLQDILQGKCYTSVSTVPFPQADIFERVINTCEVIHNQNGITKKDLNTHDGFQFDFRQIAYYVGAARYLGFVSSTKDELMLTKKGEELFTKTITERQILFVKAILEHEVFAKSLECYLSMSSPPSKSCIIEIMLTYDETCRQLNESTLERRSSTVLSWINWILNLCDDEYCSSWS